MRTYLLAALSFLMMGCGSNPEPVVKERIAVITEMAVILEGVKDDASAEAAKAKLDQAAGRLAEFDKKIKDFKPADQSKAQDKLKPDADAALDKLKKAGWAAGIAVPGKARQLRDSVSQSLPGSDVVPLPQTLIVGKWEPDGKDLPQGMTAVIEFKPNGDLHMAMGPLTMTGKYKFLTDQELELELEFLGKKDTKKFKVAVGQDVLSTTDDKGKVERMKRKP